MIRILHGLFIDSMIIYEMVRFKSPNHSTEFWNEVDKKMLYYRKYEGYLRTKEI